MNVLVAQDTICALSTAPGLGAIAIIRVSGPDALEVVDSMFSKSLANKTKNGLYYGDLNDGDNLLDEVVISVFRGPHSYTGENTAEISCHGSPFIQQEIIKALLDRDIRMAQPGEFTMRAFANGKMDLSQAEAVADLIASESAVSHDLALKQLRGGFSDELASLREKLIHFASLIELELDFGEEDVEFADRQDLKDLVDEIKLVVKNLVDSFATGNAIKSGVPVAILGAPNMGKSTLLNALLNEERAIVSEIAGTTRDTIEDTINIEGIQFRFIDTAGIRETEDQIETIGIERAWEKAQDATLVIYLVDASSTSQEEIDAIRSTFTQNTDGNSNLLIVANKSDLGESLALKSAKAEQVIEDSVALSISAKTDKGISELKSILVSQINSGLSTDSTVVTNARHYEALSNALASLIDVRNGLDQDITGDFLAIDIRKALHHLGEITGEITTDDLLGNIFSRFCIGK